MARVTVLYFATAAERTGCPDEALDLPADCSSSAVFAALSARHPALADLLPHCRLALDLGFINGPLTLHDGAELAVIPPVSGG
jgi:molybdopterin converting factor subunit 1